jgi:hypothetical protein
VFLGYPNETARFRWVKASTSQELTQMAHSIAHRVGSFLERQGPLARGYQVVNICLKSEHEKCFEL